jgi:hypothetical protein
MKIAYIALIGLILVAYCIADAKPLTEEQVTRLATSVSKQTGVEADLLIAIAKVESSLNPKAVGRSHGEVGLMQLHPRYFPKTWDPKANMLLAANYLKKLKKSCERYGKAYYICYNRGASTKVKEPQKLAYYQKVEHARRKTPSRQLVQYGYQWRPLDDLLGGGR